MKVLVTGAAGFIGSHVVDTLVSTGAEVIGLDSLDPGVHHGAPEYLRSDVDYCFADLRQWIPDSRFDDVEAIVHLAALGGVARAAREPENIIAANCVGTARLVDAARHWTKLMRIVLAGSFSVYGENYAYCCPQCNSRMGSSRTVKNLEEGRYEVYCPQCNVPADILPATEETPPSPLETYGASKLMQELCLRGYAHATVTILRFSSVYGTRLRLDDGEATIVAKLAGWIRAGHAPMLFEDGRQLRDWVYVGDVVDTILAALEKTDMPDLINVCSGVGTTLVEACQHISNAVGVGCTPKIAGGYRPGDMRHCLGQPARMQSLIGRSPLTFREGAALAFGELEAQLASGSSPRAVTRS
jgi:dTDP-L-rhamnose 4-epimerase